MDALFELIKSLSPSEKGYFKKFAGKAADGEKSNNLLLFEAIDGQEEYNEAAVKKALKKEKFANRFSVAKNYLYNSILKSLLNYNEENSLEITLRNYICEVDLLAARGLINQAIKNAEKATLLAEKYERFEVMLQLNIMQRHFYLKLSPADNVLNLDELLKTYQAIKSRLNNMAELEVILQKQCELMLPSNHIRSTDALKANEVFFKNEILLRPLLSNSAKHIYHCIRLNYFSVTDDRKSAFAEASKLLELCERPSYYAMQYDTLSLLNAYNQFLHAAYYAGEWKQIGKRLEQFKNLKLKNELDDVKRYLYYAPFALAYYDKTNNAKAILQLFEEAEPKLKQYRKQIREEVFLAMIVTFVSGLLEYGKYAKAVDWIELYRNSYKIKQRYDVQGMVHILQLIAHYELGNVLLVNNIIKNIEYFISKSRQKSRFETTVLKFFKDLTTKGKGEKLTSAIKKQKEELDTLAKGDVMNKNRVIYPIVSAFMQSKIEGEPYHEFVKRTK